MRRSKLETLYDILTVLVKHGPSKITVLMRKANVNFSRGNKFLTLLTTKMFVNKRGSIYLITPLGKSFYKLLKPWGALEKYLRTHTT